MIIALHVTEPGREDDPVCIIPGNPLDQPFLAGPIPKQRREDLQLLSFVMTTALGGNSGHPIQILEGGDPPDRIVRIGDQQESVELTELTITEVRRDYARARQLGRQIEFQLGQRREEFQHLVGRHITLSVMNLAGLPNDVSQLVKQICEALKEDQGCVGDGVDFSAGFPEQWTSDQGFYGSIESINVLVHRGTNPNEFVISSLAQADIRLSETLAALQSRVLEKDVSPNKVLIITTGLPDNRGYVCVADGFMFDFLREHSTKVSLNPQHLRAVVLHKWGTVEWIYLFRSTSDPPNWPNAI